MWLCSVASKRLGSSMRCGCLFICLLSRHTTHVTRPTSLLARYASPITHHASHLPAFGFPRGATTTPHVSQRRISISGHVTRPNLIPYPAPLTSIVKRSRFQYRFLVVSRPSRTRVASPPPLPPTLNCCSSAGSAALQLQARCCDEHWSVSHA
jgi:hypothetical protein